MKQADAEAPAPACPAPTASRCCATPTATASPRRAACFLQDLNSPFGMALVGDTSTSPTPMPWCACRTATATRAIAAAPAQGRRPARRAAQPPLDQEPGRQPRRRDSCTSASAPTATSPRTAWTRKPAAPRSWRSTRPPARTRVFASGLRNPVGMDWQPQTRRAVGRGQRARRTRQRPRARLHDLGARRRLLRLAVQLLRPARRRARAAAAPGPGRAGDRARLRAGPAHRVARPGVLRRRAAAGALPRRRVRRPARLVEPRAAERLQGDLRAVRRRHAQRRRRGRADRLPRRRRQRARPPGRRGGRRAMARCWSPTTSATASGG